VSAMDPEDADYKCTLNEYSLQKAIKELNEDPKQRLGAVQSLRKWIRDQPHYTCRTGQQPVNIRQFTSAFRHKNSVV